MRRRITGAVLAAVLAGVGSLLVAAPANAASSIQFTKVYFDSPGSDTGSNTSLNAEYFVLKNVTGSTVTLTDWTVRDRANHVYRFTTFRLAAGAKVTVHTGRGTNTSTHRYWNRKWYVWNNTGDKAYLRTPGGTLKDTCEWTSYGSYKIC